MKFHPWTLSFENKNEKDIESQFDAYFADVRTKMQGFFMSVVIIFYLFKTHINLLNIDHRVERANYMGRIILSLICILLAFVS